jgi:hypothetical protein
MRHTDARFRAGDRSAGHLQRFRTASVQLQTAVEVANRSRNGDAHALVRNDPATFREIFVAELALRRSQNRVAYRLLPKSQNPIRSGRRQGTVYVISIFASRRRHTSARTRGVHRNARPQADRSASGPPLGPGSGVLPEAAYCSCGRQVSVPDAQRRVHAGRPWKAAARWTARDAEEDDRRLRTLGRTFPARRLGSSHT